VDSFVTIFQISQQSKRYSTSAIFLKIGLVKSYDLILKANLSWSTSPAKFCQLITSLPVLLPQLNLTTLKL